jgi:hypothetical protein
MRRPTPHYQTKFGLVIRTHWLSLFVLVLFMLAPATLCARERASLHRVAPNYPPIARQSLHLQPKPL